ncbi:MAG: hypothetical protein ACI8RD_007842 [Bacillariaceae sp.]
MTHLLAPTKQSKKQDGRMGGCTSSKMQNIPSGTAVATPTPTAKPATTTVVTNDDDDNEVLVSSSTTPLLVDLLPIPLRVYILNYLGEQTLDEIINLILVSKKMYEDCKQPGIEWKIFPTIEISPGRRKQRRRRRIRIRLRLRQENKSPTIRLLQKLRQLIETNEKIIRRYPCLKLNDVHEFNSSEFNSIITYPDYGIEQITKYFQMDWILSLVMISSSSTMYSKTLPKFYTIRIIEFSTKFT